MMWCQWIISRFVEFYQLIYFCVCGLTDFQGSRLPHLTRTFGSFGFESDRYWTYWKAETIWNSETNIIDSWWPHPVLNQTYIFGVGCNDWTYELQSGVWRGQESRRISGRHRQETEVYKLRFSQYFFPTKQSSTSGKLVVWVVCDSRGTPFTTIPFIRGSQESKPPGPKPPTNH